MNHSFSCTPYLPFLYAAAYGRLSYFCIEDELLSAVAGVCRKKPASFEEMIFTLRTVLSEYEKNYRNRPTEQSAWNRSFHALCLSMSLDPHALPDFRQRLFSLPSPECDILLRRYFLKESERDTAADLLLLPSEVRDAEARAIAYLREPDKIPPAGAPASLLLTLFSYPTAEEMTRAARLSFRVPSKTRRVLRSLSRKAGNHKTPLPFLGRLVTVTFASLACITLSLLVLFGMFRESLFPTSPPQESSEELTSEEFSSEELTSEYNPPLTEPTPDTQDNTTVTEPPYLPPTIPPTGLFFTQIPAQQLHGYLSSFRTDTVFFSASEYLQQCFRLAGTAKLPFLHPDEIAFSRTSKDCSVSLKGGEHASGEEMQFQMNIRRNKQSGGEECFDSSVDFCYTFTSNTSFTLNDALSAAGLTSASYDSISPYAKTVKKSLNLYSYTTADFGFSYSMVFYNQKPFYLEIWASFGDSSNIRIQFFFDQSQTFSEAEYGNIRVKELDMTSVGSTGIPYPAPEYKSDVFPAPEYGDNALFENALFIQSGLGVDEKLFQMTSRSIISTPSHVFSLATVYLPVFDRTFVLFGYNDYPNGNYSYALFEPDFFGIDKNYRKFAGYDKQTGLISVLNDQTGETMTVAFPKSNPMYKILQKALSDEANGKE